MWFTILLIVGCVAALFFTSGKGFRFRKKFEQHDETVITSQEQAYRNTNQPGSF